MLLLVLVVVLWRKLGDELKRALGWLVLLELAYIISSARYFAFGGDVAWGHRYVIVPVELLCLFAIPILLAHSRQLSAFARRTLWGIVIASVILQASSTVIAPNLEVSQREKGSRHSVVWNRAVNLVEIASHREDPARFAGVPVQWRTLSYLPFQLRFEFPNLARWAIALWLTLLAGLPLLALAVLRTARIEPRSGAPQNRHKIL